MKLLISTWVFLLFLFFACTEQQVEWIEQVKITDPSANNMKIIPQHPTDTDDIKLVIYDDCTYNVLTGLTKSGKTITIVKQFNSMMKRPCMMTNDTIQIGKLSVGTYTLNYKLMDIATPANPKVSLSLAFQLIVSNQ